MHFIPIQGFFHKNMHVIKKKKKFDRKVFKLQRFSQVFPNVGGKPYFGGVINPKTYLNHELGSKFFFLSDLAYKLVNLLIFENFPCKMSKNWTFQKIIGLGLNFTYEFEVCFIPHYRLPAFTLQAASRGWPGKGKGARVKCVFIPTLSFWGGHFGNVSKILSHKKDCLFPGLNQGSQLWSIKTTKFGHLLY